MKKLEQIIQQAIANKNLLHFEYEGCSRTVEPHHYGMLNYEKHLHAYQISNGSRSGHLPQWRNFLLERIEKISIEKTTFKERDTYNPSNSHYNPILQSVRESY